MHENPEKRNETKHNTHTHTPTSIHQDVEGISRKQFTIFFAYSSTPAAKYNVSTVRTILNTKENQKPTSATQSTPMLLNKNRKIIAKMLRKTASMNIRRKSIVDEKTYLKLLNN